MGIGAVWLFFHFWPGLITFFGGVAVGVYGMTTKENTDKRNTAVEKQVGRKLTEQWFDLLPSNDRERLRAWVAVYVGGTKDASGFAPAARSPASRSLANDRHGPVPDGVAEMCDLCGVNWLGA